MRVAIAGFQHETNSFAKVKASLAKWEEAGILRGDEIIKEYRESKATIAGILSRLESETEAEIVPLVFSRLMPMGNITVEANDFLEKEILNSIKEQGPWDIVFLAQHGAAVSEKYSDPDGELAERVRAIVGPDVIIVTNLDMHGNVSKKLVKNSSNGLFSGQRRWMHLQSSKQNPRHLNLPNSRSWQKIPNLQSQQRLQKRRIQNWLQLVLNRN